MGVADHYLTSCRLEVPRPQKVLETIQIRRLSCLDVDDFATKFSSKMADTLDEPMEADADLFCTALQTSLLSTLDELAPARCVNRTRLTPGHFVLSKEACTAKAYRRWRGRRMVITGTRNDQVLYRVTCRRATNLINASRTAHLASLVESSDTNHRQLWTTVNGLLHPSPPATDFPPDCYQSVADFFMVKFTNINNRQPPSPPNCRLTRYHPRFQSSPS